MSWNPNESESDSGDEDFDGPDTFKGREAFIFLVDAMLFENQERFQDCLDLIRNALLSGLLTREKDLISVVFCNTKNSPEPKDMAGMQNVVVSQNTAVLLPLKQLSKEIVEYYLNFATPDYFEFGNRYGVAEGSFTNAIRLCTNIIKQCGFKLSTSSIAYFTDRDSPHDLNSSEYQKAIQKARDLEGTDTEFNVIPMKDDFDYEKFYKEFICMVRDIELDSFPIPQPEEERKIITNRQLRQDFQKRCFAHLRWNLGEEVELSVALYNYYRKNLYPKSVKILRKDNSIVDAKHVYKIGSIDPETNETQNERYLKPGDERKILTIGGQRVDFTSEEVAKMRNPIPPGLRLLGFKPQSSLSIHHFIKTSSFLYPDDKIISGSTKLFRALWEKCIEKDKVAICTLVTRRKSRPHFVALVPSEAKTDEVTGAMRNDGFRVVFLPFENNFRNLKLTDWGVKEVPDAGVDLFQKIVKKLKVKYVPTMIKDPSLELLQANIVGLAFDIETEDAGESGMPDVAKQDERIEPFLDELTEIFGRDMEISKKRKPTSDGGGGNTSKIVKISDDCVTKDIVDSLIANNNLHSLTVKQMKNYLQTRNVKGGATKAALTDKILSLHSELNV